MAQPLSECLEGQRFCICVKVYLSRSPKARLQMRERCPDEQVSTWQDLQLEYLQPRVVVNLLNVLLRFLFLVYSGFRIGPIDLQILIVKANLQLLISGFMVFPPPQSLLGIFEPCAFTLKHLRHLIQIRIIACVYYLPDD